MGIELNTDIGGALDKLLEMNPKYQATKIFNDEIKNDPNIPRETKIAFMLQRKKIIKQAENLGKTLNLADLILKENGKSLEEKLPSLNEDWFNYFSDVAENCSNEEMQTIWAKVLAGECENVGSVSKKLISILQVIDKDCAKVFSYICSYVASYEVENDISSLFILPGNIMTRGNNYLKPSSLKGYYDNNIINEYRLMNLESLGLIKVNDIGFAMNVNELKLKYCGKIIDIKCNSDNNIPTGLITFTSAGEGLVKVLQKDLDNKKDPSYIEDFIVRYYKETGCEVTVHD